MSGDTPLANRTTGEAQPLLLEAIALEHRRPTIADIVPRELDPECYLAAFIVTTDPAVRAQDRRRARRMLTKRRKSRAMTCVCFSTVAARDEVELREWIDDLRAAGVRPASCDGSIAAAVRRLAAGEVLEWAFFRRTITAFRDVVAEGSSRAREGAPVDDRPTGENDATIAPFWEIALSDDAALPPKERLEALTALDEVGALPQCTCSPHPEHQLDEEKIDAWYAFTIRSVAKKHYRAALQIVRFPETYLAVRDAIDACVVAEVSASSNGDDFDEAR